jgi:hypothetical protein
VVAESPCNVAERHKPMIYRGTAFCCVRCEEFHTDKPLRPIEVAKLVERHKELGGTR